MRLRTTGLLVWLIVLIVLVAPDAGAGITEGGGTGILEVDTPETLPAGRLSLSLAPRYGFLDASQSRLHTFVGNAGLTLGLSSGLEASAVLPLQAFFRTDTDAGAGAIFEEDFSFRARDLELKFRKAFPLGGERLRFALQAMGTAPIGSDRLESIYTPGDSLKPFTSDEWNYGLMAITTLDLTGPTGHAPVRLHLNAGYYLNRNENDFRYRSAFRYPLPIPAPRESKENDLLLLGAGLEFPIGRLSAFGELVTEQLVNQRDLLAFQENPINANAGLRFLFPGGVGLTTGLTLNLSGDDGGTAFDPGSIYPDWEARVALSFGDVLQSRRQRLAKKRQTSPEPATAEVVETAPAAETAVPWTPAREDTAATPPVVSSTPVKPDVSKPALIEKPVAPEPKTPVAGAHEPTPADTPMTSAKPASTLDWDGDGILNAEDRCPRRAEDWDGFRDTDGCPDLDNDQDGILDLDDLCPNSQEDYLPPYPNDGCPSPFSRSERISRSGRTGEMEPAPSVKEDSRGAGSSSAPPEPSAARSLSPTPTPEPAARVVPAAAGRISDADNDGIPDDLDRCPLKAEDPDGWQDEDGCPDLDNDGDGFLDTQDRCPNAAETWNGYQDDDGCPDARPGMEATDPETRRVQARLEAQAEEQLRMTRELAHMVSSIQTMPSAATGTEPRIDPQADWDNDGVGDLHDRCPEIQEDVDGWQDEDGCPDLDNDGDGIADTQDRCPNAAETWNGYQDDDGCPDVLPQPVAPVETAEPAPSETTDKVQPVVKLEPQAPAAPEVLGVVYFPSGGIVLDAFAQNGLDKMIQKLGQHPGRTLEITGFSDSSGSEDANLRLSRQRGDRVAEYLTRAGISRARLTVLGRGEASPIADNGSVEGRGRNRRVEIRLLPDEKGGSQ